MSGSFQYKNTVNSYVETVSQHGDSVAKTPATVYLASTDGFVTTYGNGTIYSDTKATPSTAVSSAATGAGAPCLCCAILKGYYWSTTGGMSVWWTPVGE